ncbi:type II toxin-antitoxin system ParD family antitoxin [Pseudoxanthomonas gei]|uniref:Antitoxin ParD n=2 Tax=Pseudoxanthomonas gei TaxID=1383030 RepID=A0ABX0A711_9GAMM|nr:type II toxin-antitoxin system ParD family antitoxin [Pseudoxanthomonas gei]
MATLKISMPDDLKDFIDAQIGAKGYGSRSEYLCELVSRQRDVEKLRNLLLEGANTGPGKVVTEDTFKRMREELRGRVLD